jgi:signal transduction histidine kinase
MTVFTRTYIVLIVLLPISFLLSLNIADNLFEGVDRQEFIRDALAEARLLEYELMEYPQTDWQAHVRAYEPSFETRVSLLTTDELLAHKPLAQAVTNERDTPMTPAASIGHWWLLHRINDGKGYIWVEEDEGPLADIPLEEWAVILLPLLIVLLLVAAAIGYIARRIARPINELTTVTHALSEAQFDVRAKSYVEEPFRSLARQFNHMAEKIQMLVQEQQVVIGAIPHELRTPISRIRFALDMARTKKDIKSLHQQIELIDVYASDLESVVEDTLLLSRTQAKELSSYPFLLAPLLERLIEKYDQNDKQLSWTCEVTDSILGDAEIIKLAVGNLLKNSLRYAHSHIRIGILIVPDNQILIILDDDGPGIPMDQRKAIFTPFYRLDSSRSRDTGGVGLGLALVALIAQRLNGKVDVDDSPLGGARFIFSWPLA